VPTVYEQEKVELWNFDKKNILKVGTPKFQPQIYYFAATSQESKK
jgi:hypothetical protein